MKTESPDDLALKLYNEIAEFYDAKPIGIDGLWKLHFFIQAWLNDRHLVYCRQGECERPHYQKPGDITEITKAASELYESIMNPFVLCSEKLPDEGQDYLWQFDGTYKGGEFMVGRFVPHHKTVTSDAPGGEYGIEKFIAWKQLPKKIRRIKQ